MTTAAPPKPRTPPSRTPKRARSLAALIDEVLKRARAGLDDEEAVHDLRVACRRLEAGTRLNVGVLGRKRLRAVREAAKTIRRAYDQARDLEVIAAEVAPLTALSSTFREAVRLTAAAQAAQTHGGGDAADAVATLTKARGKIDEADVPARAQVATTLGEQIAAFFAELGRLRPESTDDALHEVRIDAKRLRYSMEIGRPLFPRLATQVKRMKRLQDILGRHQDAAVGLRWAEALHGGDHEATAEDRAALMRYYADLGRGQRTQLRRLLAGWGKAEMERRFLAALR